MMAGAEGFGDVPDAELPSGVAGTTRTCARLQSHALNSCHTSARDCSRMR
jgi:hypothetical protein